MAYFAKLDENNVVVKVHKVENSVITDANGVEQESLGQDFLQKLYKNQSIYKKCSFNTRKINIIHHLQVMNLTQINLKLLEDGFLL